MIITINSGNNNLSCVVQKITIDTKEAIAIDTKGGIEALNQIGANPGSKRRRTQRRNIGEMSEVRTDATIDGMKSEMKGGKKDATTDVMRNEAGEVGLVTVI